MQCRHLRECEEKQTGLKWCIFDIGLQKEKFLHEKLFCNLCESLE